jgi:alanine racemase
MTIPLRQSYVEVDLEALRSNIRLIAQTVAPSRIYATVKADAYGHGMIPCARAAMEAGAWGLAVATSDEGLELRETAGLSEAPILVMAPTLADEAEDLQFANLSIAIGSRRLLAHHLEVARSIGRPARLHIQIDTGIGRDGFRFDDYSYLQEFDVADQSFEGLFTHFSMADGLEEEAIRFTDLQQRRFEAVRAEAHLLGHHPICHLSNSGGVLRHRTSWADAVRPGLMIYGIDPAGTTETPLPLKPVLQLKSRLAAVRELQPGDSVSYGRTWTASRVTRIGIVTVGYGDGLPRSLSNIGTVLVRGLHAPIRGRICMDQLMIDLTSIPEAIEGDEVVIYGAQGNERIWLEEVAQLANTIPYELCCMLGKRVPRIHRG